MKINLRFANESDMNDINSIYRKIDFKESDYENEKIIIVESNDKIVGLGRLQKVDENSSELGGIFVEDSYRGKGIAHKIVSELVDISINFEFVYCIPFEHLGMFYKSYGFVEINTLDNVPAKVSSKFKWCNEHYNQRTLLLIRDNKSFNL